MKSSSKYPETLIAYACHKAYAVLRKHYGPDSNDVTNPRGVEIAVRRDVIAVLNGATARGLHNNWANRKFGGAQKLCTLTHSEYKKGVAANPTVAVWRDIPEHDKQGFKLFCAAVHEARREHENAECESSDLTEFPQSFRIGCLGAKDPVKQAKAVDLLDAFLADRQDPFVVFSYVGKKSELLQAVKDWLSS